ncbi:MAG: type IV secretion system DNA-binding domain-containing protein [Planctomycetes bacterium]|nr:type IV secretion system DNA-binding domain-containing protein [Planctomycetota bacterium]
MTRPSEERVPHTLAEALTHQFYDWEHRGRGWTVWESPVVLEPPFQPFVHFAPNVEPGYDDGRRAGVVERFLGWAKSSLGGSAATTTPADALDGALEDVSPDLDEEDDEIVEFQVQVPPDIVVTGELAERMLLGLVGCGAPTGFELIGLPGRIVLQFVARAGDASTVRQVLESYMPEAVVAEERGVLPGAWNANETRPIVLVDFGLANEFMLPLRTPRSLAVDPIVAFAGALGTVRAGECAVLQVLFQRTAYPWAASIVRAVSDGEGGAFFADAPEVLSLAREKIGRPLFACVVRVGARAETSDRAWNLARSVGSGFSQFTAPSANELIPLSNDEYPDDEHANDLIRRRTRRSGMLLSAEELSALAHLPSTSVRSPGLRTSARTTKAAPEELSRGDVVLGENLHRGVRATVRVSAVQRLRHTYAIGGTGTGKSTFLLGLMRQDLEAGRGIALIDPHGDLADELLASVPESRIRDVVLFDPSDDAYPIGFNVLRAHSEREKEILASDLTAVFRRLSTSWGDQMTAVLGNAILAFLESTEGGTLVDLRTFLTDKSFRERFLTTVGDPSAVSFWKTEFPMLSGRPQASILTRLDAFLRPKSIRAIVAQKESKLDLSSVMDRGGILIAKLSQGAIGEENAYLLGSLLMSKLHQAALARERISESQRRDFFVYIDEFHNFATPSLGSLLSGARKYRVGLTLAHQELRQLKDDGLQSSLLANAAIRVCFRLGDEDARKFAQGTTDFEQADFMNLGIGEAICRVERGDQAFNIRVSKPAAVDRDIAAERVNLIRKSSREKFGTPREQTNAAFAARLEVREDIATRLNTDPQPTSNVVEPKRAPSSVDKIVAPKAAAASAETKQPTAQPPCAPGETIRDKREPGRGGAQHKYLQSLVKHYAEVHGFRATIEAAVDGGRVDVLLERTDAKIACEISVTSTPEQEVGNLQKCIASGCARVVLLSPSRRVLQQTEALAKTSLDRAALARVVFFTPEEFLTFLDELGIPNDPQESTVLGYRVRTNIRPATASEGDSKRDSIVQTIMRSLKRMGPKT